MTELTPALLVASNRELAGLTRLKSPPVKILLYTDAPNDVVRESSGNFGLGHMISLLEGHAPAFAKLCIKWVSRSSDNDHHADHKLTDVLKDDYDQIWFFGLHQVNKSFIFLGLGGGGPESELDAAEVETLRVWMDKGGGVLVTGDHANPRPTDALLNPNPPCPDLLRNDEFAGLGRALGRCVPRAGELRDWDGSPTSREEDSINTQFTLFTICGAQFQDQLLFQVDEKPQQLILPTFDEKGEPKLGGKPHPLFLYRDDCGPIQFFPDHLHEGQVVIPDSFPETVWPKNATTKIQPLPRVVAHGLDKRNGNKTDLLAAYDGSIAGVGRIVADATWHHYFNVNLAGFLQQTDPDCPLRTGAGSAIDQIGQFYGNLALWLSPTATRFRMAEAMFRWLAQHPHVLEELVPRSEASIDEKMRAGAAARRLLTRVSSSCEIQELLNLTIPDYYSHVEPFKMLYFPERGYNFSILPSQELLLGCVINRYPRELLNDSGDALVSVERLEKIRAAFNAGADDAFNAQESKALETAGIVQKFMAEVRLTASNLAVEEKTERGLDAFSRRQSAEGSNDMSVCAQAGWLVELVKVGAASTTARFFFVGVTVTGGKFTGRVFDSGGNETALSGTCTPFGGTTSPPNLSLISFDFTARGGGGGLVRIFISGYGFTVPGSDPPQGIIKANYVVSAVQARVTDDIRVNLAVDIGETGTGNGTST